jgi:hypothetical protein
MTAASPTKPNGIDVAVTPTPSDLNGHASEEASVSVCAPSPYAISRFAKRGEQE